jgi:hypothetical protein
MSRSKSTYPKTVFLALSALLVCTCVTSLARAQACCAGAAAVSPGRLMLHEPALVGGRLRGALGIGSFDANRNFHGNPEGSRELDFEQDVFGVVRVLRRGQVGVLVPILESWRASASTGSEFGAGIGDAQLNARYDFLWAGENQYIPGTALLGAVSLPSGRAPENAKHPLGSDATGVGVVRVTLGLALEQTWGPVLGQLSAFASKQANRHVQGVASSRAIEWSILAAAGYSFPNDVGLAAAVSYTFEGRSSIDGEQVPDTAQESLQASVAVSVPLGRAARVQSALFVSPPISEAGRNRHAETGATLTLVRSIP